MTPVSPFITKYVGCWLTFCLLAVLILWKDRGRLLVEWRRYWDFLSVPWKLWLFIPALLFVSFAGYYTDDETWDVVSGSGMAILTFVTAPWAVGLIYQVPMGRRPLRYLVVALALAIFSSSWYYDAYLLWRDGAYTVRWAGNLMISPFIYLAAGLLWNLEAKERGGIGDRSTYRLSFVRLDWPSRPEDPRFGAVAYAAIPLILAGAFLLVGFVGWTLVK